MVAMCAVLSHVEDYCTAHYANLKGQKFQGGSVVSNLGIVKMTLLGRTLQCRAKSFSEGRNLGIVKTTVGKNITL